ncbi:glycosyltransferase family 4 protein [Lonepinella sp. BR2919]|uniref:glycosyltransferase family 4 protein n=1 Tax=unclassified Lonepinella TaxID=2642006 RepID=UPI003F6DDBA3
MTISLAMIKFKQGGGIERYALDLIAGFHQAGIKPVVYAISFDEKLKQYPWIKPKKVALSWCPKFLRKQCFARTIKNAPETTLSITQIVGTDLLICGGQHKGYINALNKIPTLLDRLKIRNEQKAYQSAKTIVAHSQLMKNELMAFYDVPSEKIQVIYPPIDGQKFSPVTNEVRSKLRQKFHFAEHDIIYLFPSTGHKRKGFDLLRAYFDTQLKGSQCKLVVAGTPVEESENVVSLGFCDNMPDLYRAADFTIMASQYEPFGLVGIESILCGTPIIFSQNMACTEVLKGQFGYLFDRENTDSLHQTMQLSLSNPQRIDDPLSVLQYNPSLNHHIEKILSLVTSQ